MQCKWCGVERDAPAAGPHVCDPLPGASTPREDQGSFDPARTARERAVQRTQYKAQDSAIAGNHKSSILGSAPKGVSSESAYLAAEIPLPAAGSAARVVGL